MPEHVQQIPTDFSGLSDVDLASLEEAAVSEFDTLYAMKDLDTAGEARMSTLADGIEAIRAYRAELAKAAMARTELHGRVHTRTDSDLQGAPEIGDAVVAAARTQSCEMPSPATGNNLNVRLSQAQQYQPSQGANLTTPFGRSVIVASADIPGFTTGGEIRDMSGLVAAFTARARALPVTRVFAGDWRTVPRYPVAQVQRQYRHTLDQNASVSDVMKVLKEATDPSALVASGGWCSPSETRYDFYNIATADGQIDLPTFGVQRGGIQYPVSPSYANFLSASTCVWHWNETQDIAAATGTSQSGYKTCCEVPCATMCNKRLELEGLCATAGNLVAEAWPELVANYLNLIQVAHDRRVNAWVINQMAGTSASGTCPANSLTVSVCATGLGLVAPILDAVELQAVDYRARYAMGSRAILECVLPEWILGGARADLSKRVFGSPDYAFKITNTNIADWFTVRDIRVQFVQDWQTNAVGFPGQAVGSEITTWPTTVQFLLYAAGTFGRGNGPGLDLGVMRDSTLNQSNDHTAAWSEESLLVAKFGHESRLVTVPICPNGTVGAASTVTCPSC